MLPIKIFLAAFIAQCLYQTLLYGISYIKICKQLLLNLILPGIPGMYHVIQILKINVNKF